MAGATSTHFQDSHSMAAAAGYDTGALSAQQSVKIKSFDPNKAEDFTIWEATLISSLSKRERRSPKLGIQPGTN